MAAIGLWFAALVPLHPNILHGDLAQEVLDDGLWQLTHAVMFGVGIAGVFAAAGIVSLLGAGRRGSIILGVTIVSGVATSAAGLLEATAFPLVARRAPELIAFDGPLFSSSLFRAMTGPWLLFPLCLAALGALAYRSEPYRRAGATLALSGVGFFVLGMWFVPIVGPLSSVAFGAALLWWAAILWRVTPAVAADPSR